MARPCGDPPVHAFGGTRGLGRHPIGGQSAGSVARKVIAAFRPVRFVWWGCSRFVPKMLSRRRLAPGFRAVCAFKKFAGRHVKLTKGTQLAKNRRKRDSSRAALDRHAGKRVGGEDSPPHRPACGALPARPARGRLQNEATGPGSGNVTVADERPARGIFPATG